MTRITKVAWAAYAVFLAAAVAWRWPDHPFALDGRLPGIKVGLWVVWAAFFAYSVHCSRREDLLRSVRKIGELHWGRQVGIDLYLGFSIVVLLIGLHEGSLALALLWLVPVYVFGNLATLPYLALSFDGLVGRF